MRVLVTVMILLAMMAPVQAQPSVENNVFYGNVDCDTDAYGLSTVKESVGTNCGTGTPADSFTWELTEAAGGPTMVLEEGGTVSMTIWIGSNTHGGQVDLTSTVYSGETQIASGTGSAQYVGVATSYVRADIQATVESTVVSEPLRWVIEADGAFSSIYLRFQEGRWTQFSLPIVSVAGSSGDSDQGAGNILYEKLSAAPDVALSFTNGTNQSYVYNWTQESPSGQFNASFDGNGTVALSVLDGAGDVLFTGVVNGTMVEPFEAAAPGNWSMVVDAINATGQFSVVLESLMDHMEGNHTEMEPDDGNETAAPAARDSPGPAAILVPLAALALIRRRR